MARKWFGLILWCSALVLAAATTPSAPQIAPTGYDVVNAINALRASHGMDPYQIDGLLMLAAQAQADYLASQTTQVFDGHVGPGGTDADARVMAVGYPYVQGLDINENWATIPVEMPIETLIFEAWGDSVHMHTMLHPRGQHVGAGVSQSGEQIFVVLDVAAYWGDAGLTPQPVNAAYGLNAGTQVAISQYIAPVSRAEPAADGSITHVVQSGQSLWMLAHHYGVTMDRLRVLNGLGASDMIYIGQKILIQPPSPVKPTALASATLAVQEILADTPSPAAYFTQYATELVINAPSQLSDFSGWFVLLFALFGAGVILVVIGTTGRRS